MMQMNPAFEAFLADVIAGEAPVNWRAAGEEFSPTKLESAFDLYSWRGGDYAQTKARLQKLQCDLRASLRDRDGAALRLAIQRVLEWGGVYNGGNARWLAGLSDDELLEHIESALASTVADEFDTATFMRAGLRSNAGLTKVYALARDGFIIYDSRVAAALQMLVVSFLRGTGDATLPESLAFPGMSSKATRGQRAAAHGAQCFPRTHNISLVHMAANLRANQVLSRAMELAHGRDGSSWCTDSADGMRRLEAALFMVGYDVPQDMRRGAAG